ncbi:hypothetical protein AKJ09_05734 [Labilithrix luteola]|uniref:Collagen-like protein n=1 Tax=Labilithrix luteola TaxID=1391654 RepID=A0A0K1PZV9_9BACT|nr:type VI secretion system tube protein Hcp [Labilithrix luteola]AKU99070.1 hypothetical protein AKJ09_05734 [Labilithrix luteola]
MGKNSWFASVVLALSGIAACSQGDPGPQGAAGPPGPPGTVGAPGTTEATADAGVKENEGGVVTTEVRTIAKLAVKRTPSGPATEFDVTSFSFGVDAVVAIPVGGGSPSGGKATLAPVELQLRAGPETTALLNALFEGTHFPSATLSLIPTGGGAPVPFVTLADWIFSSHESATLAAGGTTYVETFAIAPTSLRVESGTSSATYNAATAAGECMDTCACANATGTVDLGPYAHSPNPAWPIPPNEMRIDRLDIEFDATATGGGGAGSGMFKTDLTRFDISSSFDKSGVCAFRRISAGSVAREVVVDVMSPLSAALGPKSDTTWLGCSTLLSSVRFQGSTSGVVQNLSLRPLALIRTTRSFDPTTGAVTNEATTGWNFGTKTNVASCAP